MPNFNKLKRVGVYTENEFLFQKIKLEFLGVATVTMLSPKESSDGYELTLVNRDEPAFSENSGITMSRDGGEIPLPFRIGALAALLEEANANFIKIIPSEKTVTAGEVTAKLTELEFSLFNLLYSRKGEFVSRDEILTLVWNGKADKGILNVYVHYLREKLEKNGEKIILSSRNYGYKINEKYLGGIKNA